jgi:chorismate-pyruvate lyase
MSPLTQQIAALLRPLSDFYADAGVAPPEIQEIDGAAMPQPYRRLLVHVSDMTPTLEAFCGDQIHLRRLKVRQEGQALYREVTLVTDHGEKPMEFGAIRIYLDRFTPAAQGQILEGRVPLGTILRLHAVPHHSKPRAYFSVTSEPVIAAALNVPTGCRLYGRHNVLCNPAEQPLAEVVEILPIFDSPEDGAAS